MNVRRGDIVIMDFPYSDQASCKVRQHLLCKRMSGISGLIPHFLPALGVSIGEWERQRSILLTLRQLKDNKPAFTLILSFNVKN